MTEDTPAAVLAFAQLLGEETDPAKRRAMVKRAEMLAMNEADEAAFAVQPLHVENLADLAAENAQPPGTLGGDQIIVEGQVNWLCGHPEHGKTTVAMHSALTGTRAERGVLWLDWEGGRAPTARRLAAMGALDDDFNRFSYAGFPRLTADEKSLNQIVASLGKLGEKPLVVFDSASKALSIAGLDENSPKDATLWTTEIIMPLREYATVVVVDHVVKSATRTMPYARGAGSKLADTEVLWYVEAEVKFNRAQSGRLRLTKHKDREGILPPEVYLKIGDGAGLLTVERIDGEPTKADRKVTRIRAAVLAFLTQQDGEEFSTHQIEGMIEGKGADIRTALKELVSDPSAPVAARKGERNAILYRFHASAKSALELSTCGV
jgi:AAA domain